jgi:hypothetical protein
MSCDNTLKRALFKILREQPKKYNNKDVQYLEKLNLECRGLD